MNKKLGPGDDLEMINSPELWPLWPILAMKRYHKDKPGEFPETGVIFDGEPTTVLVGCIGLTEFTHPECEKVTYRTVEDLLADRWIVD